MWTPHGGRDPLAGLASGNFFSVTVGANLRNFFGPKTCQTMLIFWPFFKKKSAKNTRKTSLSSGNAAPEESFYFQSGGPGSPSWEGGGGRGASGFFPCLVEWLARTTREPTPEILKQSPIGAHSRSPYSTVRFGMDETRGTQGVWRFVACSLQAQLLCLIRYPLLQVWQWFGFHEICSGFFFLQVIL